MTGMFAVLDLDGTIADTSALDGLRQQRNWKGCVAQLSKTLVFPGVREALHDVRSKGVRVAVVTNSVSFYAVALLHHHKIEHDALICYHDTKLHKPHPAPVLEAMRLLSVPGPKGGWGVGDHENDCAAYASAGLLTAGAGWNKALARGADWKTVLAEPREIRDLFRAGWQGHLARTA